MPETAPARRRPSKEERVSRQRGPSEPQATPVLEYADLENESVEALVARGTAYVREYAKVEHASTLLLRNLAAVILNLRLRCTLEDGRADLAGQSFEYRQQAAELYRAAGVPADSKARTQANVRWHISQLIRQVVTPAELEASGLAQASILDKQRDRQATNAALLYAARAENEASDPTSHPIKATADHLRMSNGALGILNKLSPDVIRDDMTPGQRAKLDATLAEVQEIVRRLRRSTKDRSSGA